MQVKENDKSQRIKSYFVAILFTFVAVIGVLMTLSKTGDNVQNSATQDTVQRIGKDSAVTDSSQAALNRDFDQKGKNGGLEKDYSSSITRTIMISVLFILVITIGLILFKKKFHSAKTFGLDMDIIGKRYFGQKHYLMMVRIEDRKLLLGVTDHAINLIKEFEISAAEKEALQHEQPANPDDSDKFSKVLKRIKFNKG